MGVYGVSQVSRLVTNIFLARLLAPELFGIMLIVMSLRTGVELISDVGIGQNIVYSKDAEDPDFYNTAWSVQLVRSIVLWLVCLAVASPVAQFYQLPILASVIPITTLAIVFMGFSSVSRSLMLKRLQIARLSAFELIIVLLNSAAFVLFAYLSPTIWAQVFGVLFGSAVSMIGSYFLLPDVKQRFYISKQFVWQIVGFGKWIFLSSIVYFLSSNFDRLYLAKAVPLELLGVYGIARSISELCSMLVLRLGSNLLFPFIASHSQTPRADLRQQLASIRAKFFLLAALGFSLFAATADLGIRILYDQRYQAAGWMLPVLILGSWFSIVANLNESTLLGLGKPSYSAVSNCAKFVYLLAGLPLSLTIYGPLGGIMVVALADLWRYIPILIGQRREHFSYGMQDFLITIAVFSLMAFWEWLRWALGFGTSFESLPIEFGSLYGIIR